MAKAKKVAHGIKKGRSNRNCGKSSDKTVAIRRRRLKFCNFIGYLSHYSNLPEVEIVDEMLAILSDRNAIMRKKEMELAQAKINELYNQ